MREGMSLSIRCQATSLLRVYAYRLPEGVGAAAALTGWTPGVGQRQPIVKQLG
jgi:hypothetical protein